MPQNKANKELEDTKFTERPTMTHTCSRGKMTWINIQCRFALVDHPVLESCLPEKDVCCACRLKVPIFSAPVGCRPLEYRNSAPEIDDVLGSFRASTRRQIFSEYILNLMTMSCAVVLVPVAAAHLRSQLRRMR